MKVLMLNGSPMANGNTAMAFLMKSIALGKAAYGLPEKEPRQVTSFIR